MMRNRRVFDKKLEREYGKVLMIANIMNRDMIGKQLPFVTVPNLVRWSGYSEDKIYEVLDIIVDLNPRYYSQDILQSHWKQIREGVDSIEVIGRTTARASMMTERLFKQAVYVDIDKLNYSSMMLDVSERYDLDFFRWMFIECIEYRFSKIEDITKITGYPVDVIFEMIQIPGMNQKKYEKFKAKVYRMIDFYA